MMVTLGSSSAIVAHNLASLGSRVGFVSCIGDDPLGDIALKRLSASGACVEEVIRKSAIQTGLTVILQHGSWRNILTYPGTIFDLKLENINFDYISASRHFHLSSFYLQRGLRPHIPDLFRRLKQHGLTISLDPNDDPEDEWKSDIEEALQYVDVLLPNAREAMKITETQSVDDAVSKLASIVPIVVVKLGPEGALAQRGPDRFVSPAKRIQVVDPVGAGDSFDAGFLHQFVQGGDLQTCLAAGNLAGALSTTRPGGTEAFRDSGYRDGFLRSHRSDN